jgi:hypothetical protein
MLRLQSLFLLMLSVGCAATPSITLRVSGARTARLAPEVVRQLDDAHAASLRDIDRDLDHVRQRVVAAHKALTIARTEPVVPDVTDIHAAKVARDEYDLKWEEAMLHVTEWRRASTLAVVELAKAEMLSRAGDNIDVPSYANQHERMRVGLANAVREQTAMRSQLDDGERRLAFAKDRYSRAKAEHVVTATTHGKALGARLDDHTIQGPPLRVAAQ